MCPDLENSRSCLLYTSDAADEEEEEQAEDERVRKGERRVDNALARLGRVEELLDVARAALGERLVLRERRREALEPVSKKPLQLRFNMTLYESMRAMFVSRSRELVQR